MGQASSNRDQGILARSCRVDGSFLRLMCHPSHAQAYATLPRRCTPHHLLVCTLGLAMLALLICADGRDCSASISALRCGPSHTPRLRVDVALSFEQVHAVNTWLHRYLFPYQLVAARAVLTQTAARFRTEAFCSIRSNISRREMWLTATCVKPYAQVMLIC